MRSFVARVYYHNEDKVECVVEIPKDGTPLIIGRLPACAIVTRNITVSRRHAEIWYSEGEVRFKDRGSSNGCFYSGQRIQERVLQDGDRVYCGNFEVRYEHTPMPVAEPMWEEPAAPEVETPASELPPDLPAPAPEEASAGGAGRIATVSAFEAVDLEAAIREVEATTGEAIDPPAADDVLDAAEAPREPDIHEVPEPPSGEILDKLMGEFEQSEPAPSPAPEVDDDDGAAPEEHSIEAHELEEDAIEPIEEADVVEPDVAEPEIVAEDGEGDEASEDDRSDTDSHSMKDAAKAHVAALEKMVRERDAEIARVRVELEAQESMLRLLNESDEGHATSRDEEVVRLNERVLALEDENKALEEAREETRVARAECDELDARIGEMTEANAALGEDVKGLNRSIEEKNREYQELFKKYSERAGEDEISTDLKLELEKTREALAAAKTESDGLVEAAREEAGQVRAELEALRETAAEELVEAAKAATAEREELEAAHAAAVEALEAAQEAELERGQELESKGAEIEERLETLRRELAGALGLDSPADEEIKEALLDLQREGDTQTATVAERDQKISDLESKLASLEEGIVKKEKSISDAESEFAQYRSEKHDELTELRAQVKEFPPDRFQELSDKLVAMSNENRDLKTITEDISFILGLGYQVVPETIKREIKELKGTIERFQEQEESLLAKLAEAEAAREEREAEKERYMAKAKELEEKRDALRAELEESVRELGKTKAISEQYSQERFSTLEKKVQEADHENEELQNANRSYLKKVSGLINEKESFEKRIAELEQKLFDDKKEDELGEVISRLTAEKAEVTKRLSVYEKSVSDFASSFTDKYGDWKMNLQIVTGVTEDLQDELEGNPIAVETSNSLLRHLGLLRDGSTELKKLLFEFRKKLGN